ncbi:MAG: DM13 domain-containing protein [Candidatus Limnocylindria bacterium]
MSRALDRVRADRRIQAAILAVLLAGAAFTWWTVSPFFLTTTASEALPTARPTQPATAPAATGAPSTASPEPTDNEPTVLARGELQRIDDLHQGRGPVLLLEVGGTRYLRFEDVAIQNGPDLHVYLARGSGGAYDGERDLYLGALKATNGSFNYEVPTGIELSEYRSVVVWCRAFAVLFTWADLERG